MKQLTRIRYILFSFLGLLLFISGCNKEMGMSLGSLDENLGVTLMDSLSISTSTVQLEYIPSANTGTLLVGKTNHPVIGSTIASAYFRLALTSFTNDIPEGAAFTSADLVLTPNTAKYYYGDTLQPQKFHVHRVTETIETKTIPTVPGIDNIPVYVTGATIFSHQAFDYDASALGLLEFTPKIKSNDTIRIPLNYGFGEDLFLKIRTGDAAVSSNDNFQQYLKGLVVVPDDQNTVILGLNDTVSVNLNYSYQGSDGFTKTGKKTITTGSSAYQYNNIAYDRSGTATFAPLTRTNRELKSSSTNGDIFLQAGTGVVAKLEFPSLRQFLSEPNMAVNKIELEIETRGQNYGAYPLPSSLMLFIANKHTGVPISFVRAPFSTAIQTATLVPGDLFGKNAKYTFNLIDYIKTASDIAYAETCLYLAASSPSLFGTTDMAVIAKDENNQPKIKLNILYTKFK